MGDHLAGTIVVGERVPKSPSVGSIQMPPQLASWAAGLDLVGVPDGLVLAIRTFLLRAQTLTPAARDATAVQLATQLSGYLRNPAPHGTAASAYLNAVLAERTRRQVTGTVQYPGIQYR